MSADDLKRTCRGTSSPMSSGHSLAASETEDEAFSSLSRTPLSPLMLCPVVAAIASTWDGILAGHLGL